MADTQRSPSGITHFARLVDGQPTPLNLKGPVVAEVDAERRFLITCNHTATHLLHAALHDVVSEKAFQAGSLVAPDRLRFDFSFSRPLNSDEVEAIERHVNENIRRAVAVRTHLDVPREKAEEMGAMAIFGEKYGESVRVVEVPGHSTELCGGCHVANTRDIAFFQIVSETGVAAGVRRIEAITNRGAFERATHNRALLESLAVSLKTDVGALEGRVTKLLQERAELGRRVDQLSQRAASDGASSIVDNAVEVDGVRIAAARIDAANRNDLLKFADAIRPKLGELATVLLAATIEDKPALACVVTESLFKQKGVKAGDLINEVAPIVGGRGGGRPTLAQAGGNDASRLDEAVAAFTDKVKGRLGA